MSPFAASISNPALPENAMVLADKAYDANAIREMIDGQGAWANIPPKSNRKDPICFSCGS